jgi:hypothetical protein
VNPILTDTAQKAALELEIKECRKSAKRNRQRQPIDVTKI